ncbi:CPBP family intramembrane glutamic endopeptidase [Salinicoccus kekensis]|uniref:CAAX prenyl protease 2/Lysostaphin resistance protein A-like domain-containing protein n=1 Tax=Salinicoccus kekensis TaxID=714307 RepID=A0A285UHI6_9STAP|nr:CPBP family intramembrane glutamic endopeptidase [Salinicoccus kekensis]SOC41272.1 hypothetical protein SAMN05878391_1304 [Salinicoccus kekensis]
MKNLFRKRQINSALILIIFIGVQLAVLPVGIIMGLTSPELSPDELVTSIIPYQFAAFLIGTILVIIIGGMHYNKNAIEQGKKTDIPVTIVWIIGGVVLAYASQVIAGMINVYILGNPLESQNTNEIINMIESMPLMILIVAILGPIIEEYVFRRAIFGEVYTLFPMHNTGYKVLAFLIAGLVSGLIFAVAHLDFTHILIYLAMSYTFSFLYVMTGRLLVPIFVHMIMNSLVVGLNVLLGDYIDELQQLEETMAVIVSVIRHIHF